MTDANTTDTHPGLLSARNAAASVQLHQVCATPALHSAHTANKGGTPQMIAITHKSSSALAIYLDWTPAVRPLMQPQYQHTGLLVALTLCRRGETQGTANNTPKMTCEQTNPSIYG